MDTPTDKNIMILSTSKEEDELILKYMQQQVGNKDTYNVLFNNCRDYALNQFLNIQINVIKRVGGSLK